MTGPLFLALRFGAFVFWFKAGPAPRQPRTPTGPASGIESRSSSLATRRALSGGACSILESPPPSLPHLASGLRAARGPMVEKRVVDLLRNAVTARTDSRRTGLSRCAMDTVPRIASIFPVHDLETARAHYERLGFTVRSSSGGGYGYAVRDGVELHLGSSPAGSRCVSSAYLFVDDADELAAAWAASGVAVHQPQDTQWGRREGAVVDPDGNVIRFGSPLESR